MTTYEPHEFATTFPLIDESTPEWANFVADIKANGLRIPIILFEGKVLDGRNRQRACQVAGVEPRFEQFTGTREQAAKCSASANLYRRHLNPGQIVVCVARNQTLMGTFIKQADEALKASQGTIQTNTSTKPRASQPVDEPEAKVTSSLEKALTTDSGKKAVPRDVKIQLAEVTGTNHQTAQAGINYVRAEVAPKTGDRDGFFRPAPRVKSAFESGRMAVEAASVLVRHPQEVQNQILTTLKEQKKEPSRANVKAAVAEHKRDEQRVAAVEAAAKAPKSSTVDLRLGRWQDVLVDITCDCLIVDPPYSERTHAAETTRDDARGGTNKNITADEISNRLADASGFTPTYDFWTPADVLDFVTAWSPRVKGWMVALTDSELLPAWRDAYRAAGRYAFAPIPCVWRGMSTRISGDGPASWCVYAVVARPISREFATWGTLPGAYVEMYESELYDQYPPSKAGGGRGKPDWLMSALVRDYSREGNVVCDPMAGWGSTLIAALRGGRRVVGGEVDEKARAESLVRIGEVTGVK